MRRTAHRARWGTGIQRPYTRTMYVYTLYSPSSSTRRVEAKVTRLRIYSWSRPFSFPRPFRLVSRERENKTKATRASPRMTLASIAGFKRVVRQLPRVHFPFCPTAIFLRLEDVFTATDTPLYTSPLPRRRWKTMSRARPRREILKIFHPVSMIDGYGSSSSRVKQPSRDAREYRSIYFLPIRVVKRYG